MKEKKKIVKKCSNCVFRVYTKECTGKHLCEKWVYKKARCSNCTFIKECKLLGKYKSDDSVCRNHKKKKKDSEVQVKVEIESKNKKDNKKSKIKDIVESKKFPTVKLKSKLPSEDEDSSNEEYSPVDLVEKVIKSDYNPAVFEMVDDSDIPRPNNPVQFIFDPNFYGVTLYPRQLYFVLEFFSAYCPYCSNTKFIRNKIEVDTPIEEIFDRTVLYEHGICPSCGKSRYDAYEDNKHKFYNQMVGCAGQRSGKSAIVAIISAYITCRYLLLPNVVDYFSLLPGTTLHGTFVGLRYQDAFDNLWSPYHTIIKEASPWFKAYHSFLDEQGQRLGIELYKLRDSFVAYTWKNLTVYPSGPDKRKLRGRTRFISCLPKNSLVNTGKGLIPIGNDLSGLTASINNKDIPITNWIKTGYKHLFSITIDKFNYNLKATGNHPVLVLEKNLKPRWKRVDELTKDDYVAIGLGGSFPKELKLNFVDSTQKNSYDIILKRINKLDKFTKVDLIKNLNYRGIYSLTHKLIKNGQLIKKYQNKKSQDGRLCIYKKTNKFNLTELMSKKESIIFPKKITKELGYILGYLVSEGNCSLINTEINFSNTDKRVIDHFCECLKVVFNLEANVSSFKPKDNNRKRYWQVRFSNENIKKFLNYLGIYSTTARKKEIPWCILQSPKIVVKAFISALYEGDGTFPGRYFSTSNTLLKQLQILLLKFNIVTILSKKKDSKKAGILRCASIYDYNKFLKNIGFIFKTKNDKIKFKSKHLNHYSIPYIKYKVNNGIDKPGKLWLDKYLRKLDTYAFSRLKKENKDIFNNAIDLTKKNFIWLKIGNIKKLDKIVPVYDITVDSKDHAFISNGFVVHNSIDEIGWFTGSDGDVKYDPDEVYKALDNSLMTIYPKSLELFEEHPDTPTAYGLYISSPSSKLDKSMRMYKQSLNSENLFGFKFPTWEINPKITKKSLSTKFAEDPVAAERDFGANPPFSNDPYINSPSYLVSLFSNKKNVFEQKGFKVVRDSLDKKLLYPKIGHRKRHNFPAVLAIDCGWKHNSFAAALCHWVKDKDDPDNLLFAVSGLIEIVPDPYPIDFVGVYENVLSPIIEEFNVKVVASDRWQSINLTQQVYQDYEIDAVQYSVKMEHFDDLRKDILSSACVFPALESDLDDLITLDKDLTTLIKNNPVNHLFLQFLLSKDTGRTVTKGDECTDDLLRAVVLGYAIMTDEEFENEFDSSGKEASPYMDVGSIIKVRGNSTAGSYNLSTKAGGARTISGVGCMRSSGR